MNLADWQFEHSVECKANKAFVWSFWTDVTNWERLEGNAVEWIKLDGPFVKGASGATKMPGLDPQNWEISALQPEISATIKMSLEGAIFYNQMSFESTSNDQTLITQSMSLTGPKAPELAPGMKAFEDNAPQGLAKLAKAIESAYAETSK